MRQVDLVQKTPLPDPTLERYFNGDYAQKNPDWDSADAPWKAALVAKLLKEHGCQTTSLVEIGCGSGAVLAALRPMFPDSSLAGFDIAPDAQRFWPQAAGGGIRFVLGDYLAMQEPVAEVVLVLDVLEHLGNPWEFLARLRDRSKLAVFHIPLDLSSSSVLRERPLLHVREKVGHLHYFTRGLALAMLDECGWEVLEARYTGAAFTAPKRSLKTRLAGIARRAAFRLLGHAGVRLLGGETLIVLARPRSTP